MTFLEGKSVDQEKVICQLYDNRKDRMEKGKESMGSCFQESLVTKCCENWGFHTCCSVLSVRHMEPAQQR